MSDEQHTFLFADLAGFTALTEAHGDEFAADAAGEFYAGVHRLLPEYGAEEVKRIGDAVMVRVDQPTAAVRLAVRLINEVGRRHGALGVRVGVHTGGAVSRDGDWFGVAVNLASRVAGSAESGEVLMTRLRGQRSPTSCRNTTSDLVARAASRTSPSRQVCLR